MHSRPPPKIRNRVKTRFAARPFPRAAGRSSPVALALTETGLIAETFGWLKRLKNSATRSRCAVFPNGKYLSTRKSAFASHGVLTEFLPNASGLDESGNAWLLFESTPVRGFATRPLPTVTMGASSMCPNTRTGQLGGPPCSAGYPHRRR